MVDALLVDEVRVGGAVRPVGVVEGELVHGHPALLAALLMLAGLEVDLVAHGGHDTVAVPLDLPGRRKCYLFKFNQINENLGEVVTHLLLKGRTLTATLTEAMMDSFCGRGEVLKRSRTLGESPAKGYFRPETSGEDKEIAVSCEKILSPSGRIVVVVVLTHLSIHFLYFVHVLTSFPLGLRVRRTCIAS